MLPSKIHGTGVFANEDISKGTVIWQWDENADQESSREEFNQKSEEEQKNILYYGYRSKNTGKYYVSNSDVHFINHYADSNSTEVIDPSSGAGTMIAKRDIKAGEEITQDYREFEHEEDTKKRGIALR